MGLTFTVNANLSYISLPATTTSTCPSQENIETLHRFAKHLIEGFPSQCSCGGDGWTRVAYLNMLDREQTCPSNWNFYTSPVRGCGRSSSGPYACDSVVYPVNGRSYFAICGRVIAYQTAQYSLGFRSATIEESYVSGVSITHGPPGARQHIWTFVGALSEMDTSGGYNCPCSNTVVTWPHEVPSFIGNDYFCDSGTPQPNHRKQAFYLNDPLWLWLY